MPKVIKQHPDKEDHFLIERAVLQYDEFKKEKPDLKQFYQCMGVPIAVLGGGPSLIEDMKKLPESVIKVSCNHHAFRVCRPNYMVFLDPIENNHSDEYRNLVKNPKAIRVSYKLIEHTDIYTINEFPKVLDPIGDSGMFATWFACYITSGDVYLCGIGLRKDGEPEHFYDNGQKHFWGGAHFENKKSKWEQVLKYCDKPERIKPVSGPLKELI